MQRPSKLLVTGAAGFIGSHLLEALLDLGRIVVGLDNYATGYPANLDDVRARVGEQVRQHFIFLETDIYDPDACRDACKASRLLGYAPRHTVAQGLAVTSEWFLQRQGKGL